MYISFYVQRARKVHSLMQLPMQLLCILLLCIGSLLRPMKICNIILQAPENQPQSAEMITILKHFSNGSERFYI